MRGTAAEGIPELLSDVKGSGLSVSLLLDQSVCVEAPGYSAPTQKELVKKVDDFVKQLEVTEENVHQIKLSSREQSKSASGLKYVGSG